MKNLLFIALLSAVTFVGCKNLQNDDTNCKDGVCTPPASTPAESSDENPSSDDGAYTPLDEPSNDKPNCQGGFCKPPKR